MPNKQPKVPQPSAAPIQELLHSAAVLGEDFERDIRPTLPQTTFENATALHTFMGLTVNEFKQATKKGRTSVQKECLRFLEDLRNDFEQIAANAAEVLGVKHG